MSNDSEFFCFAANLFECYELWQYLWQLIKIDT